MRLRLSTAKDLSRQLRSFASLTGAFRICEKPLLLGNRKGILELTACARARLRNNRFPSARAATVPAAALFSIGELSPGDRHTVFSARDAHDA